MTADEALDTATAVLYALDPPERLHWHRVGIAFTIWDPAHGLFDETFYRAFERVLREWWVLYSGFGGTLPSA